jgi:hypothetical protein
LSLAKAVGDGGGDFLSEILKIKGLFLKGVLAGNETVAGDDLLDVLPLDLFQVADPGQTEPRR